MFGAARAKELGDDDLAQIAPNASPDGLRRCSSKQTVLFPGVSTP
jgi:hypothetical protein